jgi:GntR family transcriptional regulator
VNDRQRFSRAPRRSVPAKPSETFALLRRLHADARYRQLKSRSARCLTVAVERHADGEGRFWPKLRTLADEVGVSLSTAKRAIREAVEAGLIERQPYLRPDGSQGSTTYVLDAALVHPETRWVKPERACEAKSRVNDSEEPTRWINPEPPTRRVSPEPPENGRKNGKALGEEGIDPYVVVKTTKPAPGDDRPWARLAERALREGGP